jgi:hypothetical protein
MIYNGGITEKPSTYQKMDLKRFTRISEWAVEICQGISGIGNGGFRDKYENKSA